MFNQKWPSQLILIEQTYESCHILAVSRSLLYSKCGHYVKNYNKLKGQSYGNWNVITSISIHLPQAGYAVDINDITYISMKYIYTRKGFPKYWTASVQSVEGREFNSLFYFFLVNASFPWLRFMSSKQGTIWCQFQSLCVKVKYYV